jgi:transcriptional regulator with XRE-family HTH domain
MEEAGQKLKRVRERLGLRYRDVEEFSQQIADRHRNNEFAIALSRLADIENHGTVPTLYKLYSLCAIYRLDIGEVMRWYDVAVSELPADVALLEQQQTHLIGLGAMPDGMSRGQIQVPISLDPGFDWRKTTFLSRVIQKWGTLPLMFLDGAELKDHRYAFVGTEDWFMYPLLYPGSLVLIDETKRKISASGWSHETDRPIYFFEHHDGYAMGWCSQQDGHLVLQPHPSSQCSPLIFPCPSGIEVIGQVVGVAMRLDQGRRRHIRS